MIFLDSANGLCVRLDIPCRRTDPGVRDLSKDTKDNWEISRDQITLSNKLGSGMFGDVHKGESS